MKKIFTLVCAAIMSLSAVNAKLIFQESFDGKNGAVGQLSAGATNSEEFFDGFNYEETRWWTALGSSNYIQVAEGSLSYAGYQSTGLGNKAYLWSSGADDVRSFASKPVTSGSAFMGAIINVESLKQSTTPDYIMSLCDHANGYYLGRLYVKSVKDEGGNWAGYKLGVAKANDGENYLRYTSEVFAPNTNVLVVIEYEFVSGEKNDIVRLYVNPSKETSAATLECVQDTVTGGGMARGAATQADAGIYGLFGAFLRQGTNTPKVYVDEIKVATAWADLWQEGEGEQEEDKKEVDNIAALKAAKAYESVLLKSQPVVVYIKNGDLAIQDESGAVLVNDFGDYKLLKDAKVGDKISNVTLTPVESDKFIDGLPVARLGYKTTPEIVSSGNSATPFEVSLAEAAKYGPALISIKEVEFVIGVEGKFVEGQNAIEQGEVEAALIVPSGCDIIGEDLPGKATVKAVVTKNEENDLRIQISASADVTDRVEKSGTGFESTQKSEIRSQKAIINGQLVIIRGDKMFNALGTEL